MPANENVQYEILNTLGPHPVISIRVDSPHESPKQEHAPSSIAEDDDDAVIVETPIDEIVRDDFDPDEPIDVTLPRDTRDIFYDYPQEQEPQDNIQQSGNQDHSWPIVQTTTTSTVQSEQTEQNNSNNTTTVNNQDNNSDQSIRWQSSFWVFIHKIIDKVKDTILFNSKVHDNNALIRLLRLAEKNCINFRLLLPFVTRVYVYIWINRYKMRFILKTNFFDNTTARCGYWIIRPTSN